MNLEREFRLGGCLIDRANRRRSGACENTVINTCVHTRETSHFRVAKNAPPESLKNSRSHASRYAGTAVLLTSRNHSRESAQVELGGQIVHMIVHGGSMQSCTASSHALLPALCSCQWLQVRRSAIRSTSTIQGARHCSAVLQSRGRYPAVQAGLPLATYVPPAAR